MLQHTKKEQVNKRGIKQKILKNKITILNFMKGKKFKMFLLYNLKTFIRKKRKREEERERRKDREA